MVYVFEHQTERHPVMARALEVVPEGVGYLTMPQEDVPADLVLYQLVDGALVLDAEKAKATQKAAINAARALALADPSATVTVDGVVFQADPLSISELAKAISLFSAAGGAPPGFEWRDINDTNHPADLAFLVKIALARSEQERAIWAKSWAEKDAL